MSKGKIIEIPAVSGGNFRRLSALQKRGFFTSFPSCGTDLLRSKKSN